VLGTDQEGAIYQFGAFELDRRSGELRKRGIRLKLQEQPLQILLLLLERAGEVVTREDIRRRLWPEDTFVDFDNAINSSVRKLRDALGDSAENPRYVETLARRGYRFLASNTNVPTEPPAPVAPIQEAPRSWFKSKTLIWLALAASVVSLTTVLFQQWPSRQRRTASDALPVPVPLTTYPGFQWFPAFSPEGTRVAFAWDEPGKRPSNIYVS
jgi:DNA-binding winged helix-turn-helix (wHTH) protein